MGGREPGSCHAIILLKGRHGGGPVFLALYTCFDAIMVNLLRVVCAAVPSPAAFSMARVPMSSTGVGTGRPLRHSLRFGELLLAALLQELLQRIALDSHGAANPGGLDLPSVNELPKCCSREARVCFRLLVIEPCRRNRGLAVIFRHGVSPFFLKFGFL